MPKLTPFLSALLAQGADALLLDAEEPVRLTTGDRRRVVSRNAISAAQLKALVSEIAPADAARAVEAGGKATFTYRSPQGDVFEIAVGGNGGGPAARIVAVSQKQTSSQRPSAPDGNGNTPAAPEAAAERPAGRAPAGGAAARAELERLLRQLVESGGSDLHLRVGEPPVLRTDGEMRRLDGGPLEDGPLEAMLMSIMPERNREEYATLSDTDFAYEVPELARFRCNALRERRGPGGVFRIVPSRIPSVDDLGLSPEVQRLCWLTKGLVLVTGPTGSGKSTTLSALIDLINRTRSDHVITIEDPIEFVHENKRCIITQRQVGSHTSSFKNALRAALREDPDIILVGELRDLETVSIAIETAETGHLVFGTLHTSTAPSTIDRLVDQFPADRQEQIRVMLSESLKGVISQTLCKKIGGGRVAAREIMLTTPALSNLIREGKTFQIPSVIQTQKKVGMVTLNDALIDVVDKKLVEPSEAYSKAIDKTGFAAMLKQHGHDVSFLDGGAAARSERSSAPPHAAARG